jgi:hypothetical protein
VNAAERATNLNLASKIATTVSLFRSEFPDAKADLTPWANDPDTRELVDPDSIDLSFHFPGWSRSWQSRSILLQIRLHQDPIDRQHHCIGIEAAGFDHCGERWRLSTVEQWEIVGALSPKPEIIDKLKQFCRHTVEVFRSIES